MQTPKPSLKPTKFIRSKTTWSSVVYNLITIVTALVAAILISATAFLLIPVYAFFEAKYERKKVKLLGYPEIADPQPPIPASSGLATWGKIKQRFNESATWRSTGYFLIMLIFGFIDLFLECLLFTVAIIFICMPIIMLFTPVSVGDTTTSNPGVGLVIMVIGIALFLVTLYINYFLANTQISIANNLLSPSEEEYKKQIASLKTSRTDLVDAFSVERKRIERDLHDGAQQELVGLSMQLGSLAKEYHGDPTLENKISEAQTRVEQALATLRKVVKGIYPQVLEDHGLYAALLEINSPIELTVQKTPNWNETDRLAKELAAGMYFIACEAVTNVIKHAEATKISITLDKTNDILTMTIVDDGKGGANFTGGTGLVGMRERADTLGANIVVTSPTGGPTVINFIKPIK